MCKRLKLSDGAAAVSSVSGSLSRATKKTRPTVEFSATESNKSAEGEKVIDHSEGDVEADNTPCMYCELIYCQSSVEWYRCKNCLKWACGNCAAMGRKKVFLCDSCK